MKSNIHFSVLLNETLNALNIKPDGTYVDATLGRAGHASAILQRLNEKGKLIGIDQDIEAIKWSQNLFANDKRVNIVKANFHEIANVMNQLKTAGADGILMDLGVSSPQLDNADRGFSYRCDGPLDMRMDQSQTLDAKTIVNQFSFSELVNIFRNYGEIKNPNGVVKQIINQRSLAPIETTTQLVNLIRDSIPKKELFKKNHHPEKIYFQSLRIAVNNEIDHLSEAIKIAANLLNINGILAIITFHSLEDKIVKKTFSELARNKLPKEVPISQTFCDFEIVTPKGILPQALELKTNSRSKSAKLRVLKRINCFNNSFKL